MEHNRISETVILFEDDERSLNYKFEPFAKQLKSTKVLSIEYDKDEFLQFELIGSKPEIGSVYYKHPYKNDSYVNSNLTDFYFMNEKLELIGHLVKLLGAKSFEATVNIEDIEKIEFLTEGKTNYKVVKVEANYKKEETQKLVSKLKLKREFEQDDNFDQMHNYNKVLGYIQKYNLSAESSIIGLIESRDPTVGNYNKYQELSTELTSEYNSILDFAACLNVMKNVFNLNFGYNKQFESIKKVNLEMKVHF
jgi:hypothetical protein